MLARLKLPSYLAERMMSEADVNHDGKIDRDEFSALGKKVKGALMTVLDEPKVTAKEQAKSAAASAGIDIFPELHAFWPAFINGLMMIWATEVGDKTFFIAAILAMSNDRLVVFSGAILALAVMTVLTRTTIFNTFLKVIQHLTQMIMVLFTNTIRLITVRFK